MQRKTNNSAAEIEYERSHRAKYAKLTAHYGKIGSAALNAALLHAKCRKEKALEQVAGTFRRISG